MVASTDARSGQAGEFHKRAGFVPPQRSHRLTRCTTTGRLISENQQHAIPARRRQATTKHQGPGLRGASETFSGEGCDNRKHTPNTGAAFPSSWASIESPDIIPPHPGLNHACGWNTREVRGRERLCSSAATSLHPGEEPKTCVLEGGGTRDPLTLTHLERDQHPRSLVHRGVEAGVHLRWARLVADGTYMVLVRRWITLGWFGTESRGRAQPRPLPHRPDGWQPSDPVSPSV